MASASSKQQETWHFIVSRANDTLQTNPLQVAGKLVFSVQYIYTVG